MKDIQDQFSASYPILSLKFYSREHADLEGSSISYEIDLITPVSLLNPEISSGTIELKDEMTVTELKSILEKEFGLHGQEWV